MIRFQVSITPDALLHIEATFDFIREQSPQNAEKWLRELYDKVRSLTAMPQRCGYARENDAFQLEVRCMRHNSHRILFTIDESNLVVRVHAVLHASRDDLDGDEF